MHTGAFEISVDNMPVWSKLKSGKIPLQPELFEIIDNHLQMNYNQVPILPKFTNIYKYKYL
jgi:hypothetical protein